MLRASGSLREGLVVEACRGTRCEAWVRFPSRPYRTFVEARVSPSGRFFYVWSRPDRGAREIDVFAVPSREAQLANRHGHWSPGAGGELSWVAGDRLWHVWRCGAGCSVAQLYTTTGATLLSLTGTDIERSEDGRFAVVATRSEGVLVDLVRATLRPHRGPPGLSYVRGSLRWTDDHAELSFEPASHDDNDRVDGTRTLHIIPATRGAFPARSSRSAATFTTPQGASPTAPMTHPATPTAPVTPLPRPTHSPPRRMLRAAMQVTPPSR